MRALAHFVWGLLILTLCVGTAEAEPISENRFVVVVGANVGSPNDDPLRYAESDAERFRDLVVELGGVPSERAFLLLGGKPEGLWRVLSEVRGRVAELARMGRTSTLIFYFAGHGDEDAIHLPTAVIPLSDLRRELAAVPARLHITLLDACRTGGRIKGVTRGPGFQVALGPEGPHGTVEMRASSDGEAAQESEELQGAIFTHFLVSGLRGAADVDGDGGVTLGELYSYTYRRTVLRSGTAKVLQHPELASSTAGAGEVVLTRPKLASAFLDVPPSPGRYIVFSMPSSRVVGELTTVGATRLAVPPGRLLVVRHLGDDTRVADFDLTMGGTRSLNNGDFRPVSREQLATRGGRLALQSLLIEESLGFEWATKRAESVALSTGVRFAYINTLEYALDARFIAGGAETTGGFSGDARAVALAATVGVRAIWNRNARFSIGVGPEVRWGWQYLIRDNKGTDSKVNTFSELGARTALRFGIPIGRDMTVSGEGAFTPIFRFEEQPAASPEMRTGTSLAIHTVLAANVGFGYAF